MNQVFTSDAELRRQILLALQKATEYVVSELYDHNESLIDALVYGADDPEVYDRTYEFREAWRKETHMTISGNNVQGKMSFDASKLTPNADLGQHASLVNGEPMQSYLADIIYEGTAGKIFGEGFWTKPRNAYAELDRWLTNTQFRQLFEEGMTQAGLSFVRKKAALQVTREK